VVVVHLVDESHAKLYNPNPIRLMLINEILITLDFNNNHSSNLDNIQRRV